LNTELSEQLHGKKIICFGTGKAGENFAESCPFSVAYFVDNNPEAWEGTIQEIPIDSPERLRGEDYDNIAILITSMYYREIANQLREMGLEEGRHFFDGAKLDENNEPFFPVMDRAESRYGYGKPPHQRLNQIIGSEIEHYSDNLRMLTKYSSGLNNVPLYPPANDYAGPYWNNSWLPGLDAVSIYGFIAARKPRNYFEIGSGNSTKFARKAITDFGLSTQIISIDPQPRREIDHICDCCIRKPLECIDLNLFNVLEAGDILFVDNSHQVYMNSDVTVVFLDILPELKPGVMVGFHDILLPDDYPPYWAKRFYAEQYLLAAWLLAEGNKLRIEMPNHYITKNVELRNELNSLWHAINTPEVPKGGAAFWIQTVT
jgi:hypothetical protein